MLQKIILATLCFVISIESSAIELISFPKENQFFTRNENNNAFCDIQLKNDIAASKTYKLIVISGTVTTHNEIKTLTMNEFWNLELVLNGGLVNYSFYLYELGSMNASTLVVKAENILCGDAFVIYGQSNGLASFGVSDYDYTFDDQWIRNSVLNSNDEPIWYRGRKPDASVGVLGLWLAKQIVIDQEIPICIINGSIGGENIINLSQRNTGNPSDKTTFYGAILNRVLKSKSILTIKGFIWFQGEAETSAGTAAMNAYGGLVNTLYNNIITDFPPIDKFILMQINLLNSGIGENGIIRNFQANFQIDNPKVVRLATVGQSFWYDGVHYSRQGYEHIAEMIFKHLKNNEYAVVSNKTFASPRIQKAVKDVQMNRLRLIFEDGQIVNLEEYLSRPYGRRYINPYIFVNNQNHQISQIENFENEIRLKINNLNGANNISFLPSFFTDSNSPGYDGPVIKNSVGFSALTFTNFPIVELLEKPVYDEVFYKDRKVIFKLSPGIAENCINCFLKVERKRADSLTYDLRPPVMLNSTMEIDTYLRDSTTKGLWNYRVKLYNDVSISREVNFNLTLCADKSISESSASSGYIQGKILNGSTVVGYNLDFILFDKSASLNPGFQTQLGQVVNIEHRSCEDQ